MRDTILLFLFLHDLSDIRHARTETFFLFIIIELIIALNFRSMRYSIFKAPPHMWLVLAILSQIVLTAVLIQFPTMLDAFEINKPSAADLGIIFGFGVLLYLSLMEAIKAVLRRKMPAGRKIEA